MLRHGPTVGVSPAASLPAASHRLSCDCIMQLSCCISHDVEAAAGQLFKMCTSHDDTPLVGGIGASASVTLGRPDVV